MRGENPALETDQNASVLFVSYKCKKGRTIMNKKTSLLIVLSLVLSLAVSGSVLALNYSGNLGNEATFETMAEVKENAPAAMAPFSRFGGNLISHPAMDGYPDESTYVYRSSDMFGRNNAARCNTNIVVYTDKTFEDKADALAYITDMGLVDIIEEAKGAVILVTPSDPAGFGDADQKNYYALQTAMFAMNASFMVDGERYVSYDATYYGGYGFYYVIG